MFGSCWRESGLWRHAHAIIPPPLPPLPAAHLPLSRLSQARRCSRRSRQRGRASALQQPLLCFWESLQKKPNTWSLMTQHVTATQAGGGGVVNGERVGWVGDGCEEGQVAWNTIFSNNVPRIFPITKSAAENIQLLWESKSERAITTLHYTLSHPLFSTPPAPPPPPPPPTPSTHSADANPATWSDITSTVFLKPLGARRNHFLGGGEGGVERHRHSRVGVFLLLPQSSSLASREATRLQRERDQNAHQNSKLV